MKVILRKTFGNRDDIWLYDDGTVYVNGLRSKDAVVSWYEGTPRIALNPANPSILQVNDIPEIARIRVVREKGWLGSIGWRAELIDLDSSASPGVVSLAAYSGAEAKGYLFTTGAFILNAETKFWNAVCPPGHEPPKSGDVHFSMLYASIKYSSFTLRKGVKEIIVAIGGDLKL